MGFDPLQFLASTFVPGAGALTSANAIAGKGDVGNMTDVAKTVGSLVGPNQAAQQQPGQFGNYTPGINDRATLSTQDYQSQLANQQAQQQAAQNQQQALVAALSNANGIGNQSSVFGQQQALANQLQSLANGTGPSVASAQQQMQNQMIGQQLANQTGTNVANQAALMAGQRGAGANAGLIARQIGQQGASTQQQAAGQAALQAQQGSGQLAMLRAQEQLNGIGALQGQQQMMGSLAQQQIGNQMGATNALNQSALGALGQTQQAVQGQNSLANQMNVAQVGADVTRNTADKKLAGDVVGGITKGIGAALSQGGEVYPGKSTIGRHLYSQGGPVKAMLSPGEIYLTPAQAQAVKEGKMSPMQGEKIPGKAPVKGDSRKNDIVAKLLEAGGVVVKRSKAGSEEAATKFVKSVKGRK